MIKHLTDRQLLDLLHLDAEYDHELIGRLTSRRLQIDTLKAEIQDLKRQIAEARGQE